MVLHGVSSKSGPQDAYEPLEIVDKILWVCSIYVIPGRGFIDIKGMTDPQSWEKHSLRASSVKLGAGGGEENKMEEIKGSVLQEAEHGLWSQAFLG